MVKEENIRFESNGLQIEALMCIQEGERGAVITHPHPLYGGTMYNQVVTALTQVYQGKGFTTLRFNFRGTGDSEGRYDEGRGEKEDVKSALLYLDALGRRHIDLAGYSFGAWVNAKVTTNDFAVTNIIMVSPPVAVLDFSFLSLNPRITAVIAGGRDDIAPVDGISRSISVWNPAAGFEVIEGADHFYTGKIDTLKSVLSHLIG
jgi:alpha/beta superfamily hydrolase